MGAVVRSDGYTYLDLGRAKNAMQQYHNFYGIVTEWDAPRKTRGTDMVCSLWLTDLTLAETGERVELRCFAPDMHQLPHVRQPGDIIRLHRVRVESFGTSRGVHLIASLGGGRQYAWKLPSFCLFDAAPPPNSDSTKPYQKSSKTYHFDDNELSLLTVLKEYSLTKLWKPPASPISSTAGKYRKPIKSLITDEQERINFLDLVALVLAVETNDPAQENLPPVVWLWDGTESPPFPPTYYSQLKQNPESAVLERVRLLRRREFPLHLLNAEAASLLPSIGTALPVLFDSNLELPSPGSWIKIRNSGFHVVQGQVQGLANTSTRWTLWHEDRQAGPDEGRQEGLDEYQNRKRVYAASPYAPTNPDLWISETRHRDSAPFTSLRQIAVETRSAAAEFSPGKYRCMVRVIEIWPRKIDEACVPAAEAGHAAKIEGYTKPGDYMYAVRLLLEDGSGSLWVDLFGRAGEEFFALVAAPQDLAAAPEARESLLDAFGMMLGQGCSDIRGRWLELSIKSYKPDEGAGPRYKIFDSQLKYG